MQMFRLSKGSKDVGQIKTCFDEKTKVKYNTVHEFLITHENLMKIL